MPSYTIDLAVDGWFVCANRRVFLIVSRYDEVQQDAPTNLQNSACGEVSNRRPATSRHQILLPTNASWSEAQRLLLIEARQGIWLSAGIAEVGDTRPQSSSRVHRMHAVTNEQGLLP